MSFEKRLKTIRGNILQNVFAAKLGVHKNTYARWERGEREPRQSEMEKMLEIRPDINPAWLLTGEGPMIRSDVQERVGSAKTVSDELLSDDSESVDIKSDVEIFSDDLYFELADFAKRDKSGIIKLRDHIRSFIAGRDSLRDELIDSGTEFESKKTS